ncbi:sulfatase-like hydrolase/transferase [Abyssisolibacter fermentans]|uniref:sulfatase-like hydrolase/transferase n=1 Tax=Abyssisolibacter fermentans TaxID=1766203 RepID=UPI000836C400|nr:sulfatase-like hydrolase/transferase [Abyssisolibacter fermentans]
MSKKDILIFLTDQHTPNVIGINNKDVNTPNLDSLASEGTSFNRAYTSCPLCVPARMSFLTGQLPSKLNVFNNEETIYDDQATFLHSLAASGYETVLCGRMHFKGVNQRHGFTKRIMGDITTLYWGTGGKNRTDMGPFIGTTNMKGCLNVIGGGNSPVLEYDKAVIKAAVDYLNEEHEKPQCIVVGTYAPHFSYVAPEKLYKKYKEKLPLPKTWEIETNSKHSAFKHMEKDISIDDLKGVRASYYGMVENMDRQVGIVKKAWDNYLNSNDRKGVYIYMSDHGDQLGERNLFGKQTFYEDSSRIPLIIAGDGINENIIKQGAVSIMDVAPTVIELAGAEFLPNPDGKSLVKELTTSKDDIDRNIFCEHVLSKDDNTHFVGRMIYQDAYKYIHFSGYDDEDLLFDINNDPYELRNIICENEDVATELKSKILKGWNPEYILEKHINRCKNHKIMKKWGQALMPDEEERFKIPLDARILPKMK